MNSVFRPGFAAVAASVLLLAASAPCAGGEREDVEKAVRKLIISGAEETPGERVMIEMMGQALRASLNSADEEGLHVSAAGMNVTVKWRELPVDRLIGIARKFVEKKPVEEQTLLFRLAKEKGLENIAEQEAARILEDNPLAVHLLYPPEPPPSSATGSPADSPADEQGPQDAYRQPPPFAPSVPAARPAAPGRLSAASIPPQHPRLFMRPQPLGDAPVMQQVLAAARRNPGSLNRNRSSHMALDYLLSGNKSSAQRAVELMKKPGKMGWYDCGHWTADHALAFDWLFNYENFTPEDKEEVREVLEKGLEECNRWVAPGGDIHYIWNGYWICSKGAVCAAVALYGHSKVADGCIEGVLNSVDQGLLALDYTDGAWLEGPTYAVHSLNCLVPAAEVLWSATGKDPYQRHPGLARFIQWFAWMNRPDWTLTRWDDASGGSSCSTNEELAVFALAVARGSRDPEAAWFANNLVNKWGSDAWYPDIYGHYMKLWADTGTARSLARPPEKLSAVFGLGTAGFVFARSDWSDNAFHLSFRCGDSISPGHQHYCSNSFTIYHYGSLAIDSGEYHGQPLHSHIQNYAGNTIAHNAIVFRNPGRPEDDGGQARRFRHNLSNAAGLLNPGAYECGDLVGYEDKGSYMYVAGNATRAYSGDCRFWMREMVYLRPNTLVVMDRVTPGSGRVAVWLMHFLEEPDVSGNTFMARAGGGRLWCGFVLPQKVNIEKVGGKGKEYWNKGRNWPPGGRTAAFHEGGKWRVEVSSPGGGGPFLSVIQTGRGSQGAPSVAPVLDDPEGIGVVVNGRTVIFRKGSAGLSAVR